MSSFKAAEELRLARAILLGVVAWSALFLPRIFIWPTTARPLSEWWWLLIGALAYIGGPLLTAYLQKKKNKRN